MWEKVGRPIGVTGKRRFAAPLPNVGTLDPSPAWLNQQPFFKELRHLPQSGSDQIARLVLLVPITNASTVSHPASKSRRLCQKTYAKKPSIASDDQPSSFNQQPVY